MSFSENFGLKLLAHRLYFSIMNLKYFILFCELLSRASHVVSALCLLYECIL